MSSRNQTAEQPQFSHTWESVKADANWQQIHEDEDGNIISSTTVGLTPADQIRQRRKRLAKFDHALTSKRILRDMIRYVYLVLDLSETMYEKDAGLAMGQNKTRLDCLLKLAQDFINEYYDQNPLSQLGIVICKNGEAEVLTLLSGSKRSAMTGIQAIREGVMSGLVGRSGKDAGEFSLQNGITVAGRSLGHMPRHGSREIIVVVGALSTCDPGDVLVDTLPRLRSASIRVNCIAMCAEIHICRKIAESTGGIMGVCLDGRHCRDLLMNFIPPPPSLQKSDEDNGGLEVCEFVPMGFPTRITEEVPTLIHTVSSTGSGSVTKENKLMFGRTAYVCPRCKAKASELPCDCAVCGLKLVLAPHLARSFHHLFPVAPFQEIVEEIDLVESVEPDMTFSLPPIAPMSCQSFESPSKIGFSSNSNASSGENLKIVEVEIDSSLLFSSKDCDRVCFSCLKIIGVHEIPDDTKKGRLDGTAQNFLGGVETLRFQCPDCKNVFCSDCDEYLHSTLHNCPGCCTN
jgi:transcription initiation factor TFIIH subunit 2